MATKNNKEARIAAEEAEVVEQPEVDLLLDPNEPAGMPEGSVVESINPDGSVERERIVHDVDEEGNVAGFHKEAENG